MIEIAVIYVPVGRIGKWMITSEIAHILKRLFLIVVVTNTLSKKRKGS